MVVLLLEVLSYNRLSWASDFVMGWWCKIDRVVKVIRMIFNIQIYNCLYNVFQTRRTYYIVYYIKSLLVSKGQSELVEFSKTHEAEVFLPKRFPFYFTCFFLYIYFIYIFHFWRIVFFLSLTCKGLVVAWQVLWKWEAFAVSHGYGKNAAFSHYVVDPKEKLLKSGQLFEFFFTCIRFPKLFRPFEV